jgi:hypothetical protein
MKHLLTNNGVGQNALTRRSNGGLIWPVSARSECSLRQGRQHILLTQVVLWDRTSIALNSEVKKKGARSSPTDVTWISTESQFSDTHTSTLITSERRLEKAASHQPTSHFSRCVKHHQSNKLQRSTASDNGDGAVSSCGAQQESTQCLPHKGAHRIAKTLQARRAGRKCYRMSYNN